MGFGLLSLFGDAGDGDQFAFAIRENGEVGAEVYAWGHEDDSRRWVASDLRGYVDGWLTGVIAV